MPGEPSALEFAARVLGPCELVRDCSWEHRGSLVLRLRDAGGLAWFLKRHGDRERYEREAHAYRAWVPALGGSAPRLRAADDDLGAVIVSALPGRPAPWPAPGAGGLPAVFLAGERDLHRQAGMLLRQLHAARPPRPCDDFGAMKAAEFARLMPAAGHLLAPRAQDAARSAVTALAGLPGCGLVPCHQDYTPRNWLLGNGAVRVIDFEWCRLDAGISDLSRLELGIWAVRPDLKEAFLDGYGLLVTGADRVMLRGCAVITGVWLMAYALKAQRTEFAEENRDALLRLLGTA